MNTTVHTFTKDTCSNPLAKQETRERTLRNVMAMAQWDGYLTEDWVDLCGHEDETLQLLLAHNALIPGKGRYLGINDSPLVIAANKAFFAKEIQQGLCEFRCGDWNNLIQGDWTSKVSILSYDGFASVGRNKLQQTLDSTIRIAKRQRDVYGQALLYLNLSKWAGADLKPYVEFLSKTFEHSITEDQVHIYVSKRVPMASIWLRLGF